MESDVTQGVAVGQLRALLASRAVLDRLFKEAVEAAVAAGVPRTVLADELGVHRATFYRQFADVIDAARAAEMHGRGVRRVS